MSPLEEISDDLPRVSLLNLVPPALLPAPVVVSLMFCMYLYHFTV